MRKLCESYRIVLETEDGWYLAWFLLENECHACLKGQIFLEWKMVGDHLWIEVVKCRRCRRKNLDWILCEIDCLTSPGHSADNLHALKELECVLLSVLPTARFDPLTKEFEWCLWVKHVEIIDENGEFLTANRSVEVFYTDLEGVFDHFMGFVGCFPW